MGRLGRRRLEGETGRRKWNGKMGGLTGETGEEEVGG